MGPINYSTLSNQPKDTWYSWQEPCAWSNLSLKACRKENATLYGLILFMPSQNRTNWRLKQKRARWEMSWWAYLKESDRALIPTFTDVCPIKFMLHWKLCTKLNRASKNLIEFYCFSQEFSLPTRRIGTNNGRNKAEITIIKNSKLSWVTLWTKIL